MKTNRRRKSKPPHYGVYARLGPSSIHGVGVFAIRKIRKGTCIFYGDDAELVWVKKQSLENLPKEVRKLYDHFAIIKGKGNLYGCPPNFNQLTAAWYLNHSDKPNVACDVQYRFYALRDIRKCEELTADYGTYSELP